MTEAPLLGCHSFCFRDRALSGALSGATDAGFDAIELWHGHAPWDGDPAEAALRLDAAGLTVSSYCVGGFYGDSASVEKPARAAFAFARGLGTSLVTGCLSADAYEAVGRVAAEEGVRFAVENHWYQALSTPIDLTSATERGLYLSLDTGHALLAPARPEEFVRRAGPRLANIHLKDVSAPGPRARLPVKLRRRYLPPPKGSLALGRGQLDMSSLTAALRDAGYSGPVAVEVEASADPVGDLRASRPAADRLIAQLA